MPSTMGHVCRFALCCFQCIERKSQCLLVLSIALSKPPKSKSCLWGEATPLVSVLPHPLYWMPRQGSSLRRCRPLLMHSLHKQACGMAYYPSSCLWALRHQSMLSRRVGTIKSRTNSWWANRKNESILTWLIVMKQIASTTLKNSTVLIEVTVQIISGVTKPQSIIG